MWSNGNSDLAYLRLKSNTTNGNAPTVLYLTKSKTTIGRSPRADIIITADFVSRWHAIIYVNEDHVWSIIDTSSNGLFLNGVKLVEDTPKTLKHDDVIGFYSDQQELTYVIKMPFAMCQANGPLVESEPLMETSDNSADGSASSATTLNHEETSSAAENKVLKMKIDDIASDIERLETTFEMELAATKQECAELMLVLNALKVEQSSVDETELGPSASDVTLDQEKDLLKAGQGPES